MKNQIFSVVFIVFQIVLTIVPSIMGRNVYNEIQAIIGSDTGDRGMKSLIVPGDLELAGTALGTLKSSSHVIVLSGFPCCVNDSPPTETDGPPGTFAIARTAAALGHEVTVITDDCNAAVFSAALKGLVVPENCGKISLETFPAVLSPKDEERFSKFVKLCDLVISCERAGPGMDGKCYTMRGIDMNEKGLIAPLHRFFEEAGCKTISIGDGGNELGMGKVIENIINNPKIQNGRKIGCVVAADYLIAASVSNWGGYALSAAAALAHVDEINNDGRADSTQKWINRCLPSEEDEVALLDRCVAVGCRDGVSGKMESTVDGMPLETSLACLRAIRKASLQ